MAYDLYQQDVDISIHASRGGSDAVVRAKDVSKTPISIHASRGGSDTNHDFDKVPLANFNPRFPRGKRPVKVVLEPQAA